MPQSLAISGQSFRPDRRELLSHFLVLGVDARRRGGPLSACDSLLRRESGFCRGEGGYAGAG